MFSGVGSIAGSRLRAGLLRALAAANPILFVVHVPAGRLRSSRLLLPCGVLFRLCSRHGRVHQARRLRSLSLRSVLNHGRVTSFSGMRWNRSKDENQGNDSGKVKIQTSSHRQFPSVPENNAGYRRLNLAYSPSNNGHYTGPGPRSKYNLGTRLYHQGGMKHWPTRYQSSAPPANGNSAMEGPCGKLQHAS
jgi:hypothetical protein